MKVSEIFYSIQGEGTNTGRTAVFLRLAAFNLRCAWCDTKYTRDWKHYDYNKEVKEMTTDEVRDKVLEYDCRHLVLTGGEPMLQQHDLIPLLISFREKGFYIEVETNGTILPNAWMVKLVDQWNACPKTDNSKNPVHFHEKRKCYLFFSNLPNAFFKYVIQNLSDLAEVKTLVDKYGIPRKKVILMPEATTSEQLRAYPKNSPFGLASST